MKKIISVRIDEKLLLELDGIANDENRTRSNMLEVLLSESIDRYLTKRIKEREDNI